MTWTCSTCDRTFEEIPPDAMQLTKGRGTSRTRTFRFSDGSIHSLRRPPIKKLQATPEPIVVPVQQPDTKLLEEVIAVLAELPTPKP